MVETLKISLSGAALSFLIYETVRSEHQQEGFLLGEIIENHTDSLTDEVGSVTKIDRTVRIDAGLSLPDVNYLRDNLSGKLDRSKLDSFLGPHKSSVVAWYAFDRQDTPPNLSFKQRTAHKALTRYLGFKHNLFSCCLLTKSIDPTTHVHKHSQTFVRYNNCKFENVAMRVANLSEAAHLPMAVSRKKSACDQLFQSIKAERALTRVEAALKAHEALEKHTDSLNDTMVLGETEVFELERKVETCRREIRRVEDAREEGFNYKEDEDGNEDDGTGVDQDSGLFD